MFERLVPLFTEAGIQKLALKTVLVFGCGGVGSFAIEALARSGIGTLIIVDGDTVEATNLNRQIPALHSTLGKRKVDVMAERIRDINPLCTVIVHPIFYTHETRARFWLEKPDFVFDAIDTMTYKLDIIKTCKSENIPFLTSCGMGNRMFPEKIRIASLADTNYDPVAKALRIGLNKINLLNHTPCVFSEEIPIKTPGERTPSSNAFVPSTAGLVSAAYIIRHLLEV